MRESDIRKAEAKVPRDHPFRDMAVMRVARRIRDARKGR